MIPFTVAFPRWDIQLLKTVYYDNPGMPLIIIYGVMLGEGQKDSHNY